MRNETFKTNYIQHKDNTSLNPLALVFNLPGIITKMKEKQSWLKGELVSMLIFKTPAKQILLTALHEGTEIQSFQSNDSVTFQIVEGEFIFNTRKECVTLKQGQLITLHEKLKYTLTTSIETVLLLTITNEEVQLSVN